MKVLLICIFIAVASATFTSNNISKKKSCAESNINGNKKVDCTFTGTVTKSADGVCTISTFQKRTVTANRNKLVDSFPNNGVGICTQQSCDKTTEPVTVDCVAVFGEDNLKELDSL